MVLWRALEFLPYADIARLLRANRRCYELGTHNVPWRGIVERTHLGALMPAGAPGGPISNSSGGAASNGSGNSSFGSPAAVTGNSYAAASMAAAALSTATNATYLAFVREVAPLHALLGEYTFTADETSDHLATFSAVQVLVTKANLGYTCPVVRVRLHLTASANNESEWSDGILRFDTRRSQLTMTTWTEGFRFIKRLQGPSFDVLVAPVQRGWACQSKPEVARHQGGLRLILTVRTLAKTPLPWSSLGPNDLVAVSKPPPRQHTVSGGMQRGNSLAASGTPTSSARF